MSKLFGTQPHGAPGAKPAKDYGATSPREQWVLEAPDYWTACQHRGRGARIKRDNLLSRQAAFEAACSMLGDYPARPVMVYAVRGGSDALAEVVR